MKCDCRFTVETCAAILAAVACLVSSPHALLAAEQQWVFKEAVQDGRRFVSMEAEHFSSVDAGGVATVTGASGGRVLYCYDEVRARKGQVTVANYRFHIDTPGRWYVRLRIFAAHHIQNGVFLTVDGKRLIDPDGGDGAILLSKGGWGWSNRWQGEGNTDLVYTDIDEPGEHTLSIVRREPMAYYDKIVLTHQDDWAPAASDPGPVETVASAGAEWEGPPSYGLHGIEDFPYEGSGFEPDMHGPPDRAKYLIMTDGLERAEVAMPFPGKSGKYALRLEYIPDEEDPVEFSIRVAGKTVGTFLAPANVYGAEPANFYVHDVAVNSHQEIEVAAVSKTDSRARWRRLFLYGGPLLPYAEE